MPYCSVYFAVLIVSVCLHNSLTHCLIMCVSVCVCAPCSQDPASLSLLNISDLIPDLQTIFFWMSNSIEILYFIQQRAPAYTHSIETLQGTHTRTHTHKVWTMSVETTWLKSHYSHWHTGDNVTALGFALLFTINLLSVSLSSISRVKGVVAISYHNSQWGGHDYLGGSDHVHFSAMCLLYH